VLLRYKNLTWHCSGRLRRPLNFNYKGFPVRQAKRIPDGPPCGPFLHLHSHLNLPPWRQRALARRTTRCGLAKLQTVIDVAFDATDPDEGRTRGTHSLAGKLAPPLS
jgi:hypothetical protein